MITDKCPNCSKTLFRDIKAVSEFIVFECICDESINNSIELYYNTYKKYIEYIDIYYENYHIEYTFDNKKIKNIRVYNGKNYKTINDIDFVSQKNIIYLLTKEKICEYISNQIFQ